jgi:hypothetical protein
MANIDTDKMISAAETFSDSYTHVMNNYVAETKNRILLFVMDIILREKPYMLVSREGLPAIMNTVFSSDEIRDFVFTLQFVFFSRWGGTASDVEGLVGNLARGVGIANVGKVNAVPSDINARLSNETEVTELLTYNKWLCVILMLQLFVSLDEKLINAKPVKDGK